MQQPEQISLPAAFDTHVHLRQGEMLKRVGLYSGTQCSAIIVEPNTIPPVGDAEAWSAYKKECEEAVGIGTKVYPLAKLLPSTTADTIYRLRDVGCIGLKLYPEGVTTHSGDGISQDDLYSPSPALQRVFSAMEECDMVLQMHGEMPNTFSLDREAEFIYHLPGDIIRRWPKLRCTLEHITTAVAAKYVRRWADDGARIAASVTVHHLLHTLDDVLGDKLRPDHFCKPIAKRPEDRLALRSHMLAHECFFLGSDSAPHLKPAKYCNECCAGVFSAPVLLPSLATLFESLDAMSVLPRFVYNRAVEFYGIQTVQRSVSLVKRPWQVPADCWGVTPLHAGETLPWRLTDETGAS